MIHRFEYCNLYILCHRNPVLIQLLVELSK